MERPANADPRLRRRRRRPRRVATALVAALLVNIFERKQEAKNPFLKLVEVDRGRRGPEEVGRQLASAVRRLPAHRRADGHQVRRRARRSRGDAAAAEGRSATRGSPGSSRATCSPWTTGIAAATPSCSRTRRSPSATCPREGKQSGNCLHCHASIMPLYRKLGREAPPQGQPGGAGAARASSGSAR